MTSQDALLYAVSFALGVGSATLLAKLIGLTWLRKLFESEGEPSMRIVLATIVTLYTLYLESIDKDVSIEANFFFAGTLFGFGTTKLIATRFANRTPTPDVKVTNTDSVNVNPTPNATS